MHHQNYEIFWRSLALGVAWVAAFNLSCLIAFLVMAFGLPLWVHDLVKRWKPHDDVR